LTALFSLRLKHPHQPLTAELATLRLQPDVRRVAVGGDYVEVAMEVPEEGGRDRFEDAVAAAFGSTWGEHFLVAGLERKPRLRLIGDGSLG